MAATAVEVRAVLGTHRHPLAAAHHMAAVRTAAFTRGGFRTGTAAGAARRKTARAALAGAAVHFGTPVHRRTAVHLGTRVHFRPTVERRRTMEVGTAVELRVTVHARAAAEAITMVRSERRTTIAFAPISFVTGMFAARTTRHAATVLRMEAGAVRRSETVRAWTVAVGSVAAFPIITIVVATIFAVRSCVATLFASRFFARLRARAFARRAVVFGP